MQYKDAGYLPHALINYLARLGWSHGDQELFTPQELLDLFDVKDVNSKAARLDMAKLAWVNQHYLKTDDPASIAPQLEYQLAKLSVDLAAGPAAADVVVALRERVHTLKEMAEKAVVWYQPLETYDEAAVMKHLKLGARGAAGQGARAVGCSGPVERGERLGRAARCRRRAGIGHGQGCPAAARGHSPARRSARTFRKRCTWPDARVP